MHHSRATLRSLKTVSTEVVTKFLVLPMMYEGVTPQTVQENISNQIILDSDVNAPHCSLSFLVLMLKLKQQKGYQVLVLHALRQEMPNIHIVKIHLRMYVPERVFTANVFKRRVDIRYEKRVYHV